MQLNPFRLLLPCALPLALAACAIPGPATAEPPRAAPALGVDLGASSRIPKLAGLPGEGEGIGSSEPRAASAPHGSAHGSMPMSQGAMATMDHGSMSGMGHGPMAAKPMDHGSMPGMNHGPTTGTPIRQGSMPGMSHSSAGGPQLAQMAHSGQAHTKASGTVNSVDVAARKVNVTHDPIPAIGWPTMTMDFAVAPAVDLGALTPGTRVNFQMEQGQGGMYVIQSITPAGGGR